MSDAGQRSDVPARIVELVSLALARSRARTARRDIRHPMTAAGEVEYVESTWASWQRLVSSLTPGRDVERIGAVAGPYGDSERIGLVFHIVDELMHHAAEVGVMRDLYAASPRS